MTAAPWQILESSAAAPLGALHRACLAPGWSDAAIGALLATPGVRALLAGAPAMAAPVGFALLRVVSDEAEVLALGVLPQCRRRGIADALLQHLCERVAHAGARRILLEVATNNGAALALYKKHGFTVAGVRRRYFAQTLSRVDGLTMCRLLLDAAEPREEPPGGNRTPRVNPT